MRRVVVTGLGLVTPLGGDVETSWKNLIAGESGAGQITSFDPVDQKCTIACEVKDKEHPWGFDADKRVDHKIQRMTTAATKAVPYEHCWGIPNCVMLYCR